MLGCGKREPSQGVRAAPPPAVDVQTCQQGITLLGLTTEPYWLARHAGVIPDPHQVLAWGP